MGSDYELEHRKSNEDSRRQLFAILDLMEQLNSWYLEWEKEDLNTILKENPYIGEKV